MEAEGGSHGGVENRSRVDRFWVVESSYIFLDRIGVEPMGSY